MNNPQYKIIVRDMSDLPSAISDKEDEKPIETPESTEDEEDYPQAFDLVMIIVALILSMFLVR